MHGAETLLREAVLPHQNLNSSIVVCTEITAENGSLPAFFPSAHIHHAFTSKELSHYRRHLKQVLGVMYTHMGLLRIFFNNDCQQN